MSNTEEYIHNRILSLCICILYIDILPMKCECISKLLTDGIVQIDVCFEHLSISFSSFERSKSVQCSAYTHIEEIIAAQRLYVRLLLVALIDILTANKCTFNPNFGPNDSCVCYSSFRLSFVCTKDFYLFFRLILCAPNFPVNV